MKHSALPVSFRCYSYHSGLAVFLSLQDIEKLPELFASIKKDRGIPVFSGNLRRNELVSSLLDDCGAILGDAEIKLRHFKFK
jgi:hypothetical protein